MVRSGRGPFRPARARRARAMYEFPPENLRNPARDGCAGLMRQFRPSQVYDYSTRVHTAGGNRCDFLFLNCFDARTKLNLDLNRGQLPRTVEIGSAGVWRSSPDRIALTLTVRDIGGADTRKGQTPRHGVTNTGGKLYSSHTLKYARVTSERGRTRARERH
jgi:hypothetical protein